MLGQQAVWVQGSRFQGLRGVCFVVCVFPVFQGLGFRIKASGVTRLWDVRIWDFRFGLTPRVGS